MLNSIGILQAQIDTVARQTKQILDLLYAQQSTTIGSNQPGLNANCADIEELVGRDAHDPTGGGLSENSTNHRGGLFERSTNSDDGLLSMASSISTGCDISGKTNHSLSGFGISGEHASSTKTHAPTGRMPEQRHFTAGGGLCGRNPDTPALSGIALPSSVPDKNPTDQVVTIHLSNTTSHTPGDNSDPRSLTAPTPGVFSVTERHGIGSSGNSDSNNGSTESCTATNLATAKPKSIPSTRRSKGKETIRIYDASVVDLRSPSPEATPNNNSTGTSNGNGKKRTWEGNAKYQPTVEDAPEDDEN
ncbi:hypothetical protein PMZ80_003535 [Knufia obscura]|nr:hypothetical protein PMZ80_003535 [Knufia obscura]